MVGRRSDQRPTLGPGIEAGAPVDLVTAGASLGVAVKAGGPRRSAPGDRLATSWPATGRPGATGRSGSWPVSGRLAPPARGLAGPPAGDAGPPAGGAGSGPAGSGPGAGCETAAATFRAVRTGT